MSGESTADGDPVSRPESHRLEHRKKMPKRAYILGVSGLTLGLFAGFSIGAQSIPPAQIPSASPRTLQGPTERTIPGDGEFLVGTEQLADVRPGLYRSSSNSQRCTWQRERDATGEHVIASDTAEGVTSYVELHAGEFFDTADCSTWHRVSRPRGTG